MTRICYVAGPFRHASRAQMAANVLTAQAAAVMLVQAGWSPYVPHANLGHAYGLIPEADADAANDAFLACADAIYLLPGWGQSMGARRELEQARKWGLLVFREASEVPMCHLP